MEHLTDLIAKYASKGLLVDTNLLLLYIVGRCAPEQIGKHKRTNVFQREDYELLFELISRFRRLVTNPNVLTEVSNLLGQTSDDVRAILFDEFGHTIAELDEAYIPSKACIGNSAFARLGLTDIAITEQVRNEFLVLTVDLPLYLTLLSSGVDAINFNHLREV